MNGPNAVMNFAVNSQTLQLPVPGAAFIIGGYNYQYYWQGSEYSNGPFPNNSLPGGLAPQFGLVGGPTAGHGLFTGDTAGTLTSDVEMSGQSRFVPTPNAAVFGLSVDQTGEQAMNLNWTGSGPNWTMAVGPGSIDQGVVSYTVANAGNPANRSQTNYSVNFTESGLPTGTNWSVTFNGATESCTVGSTSAFCGPDAILFSASDGGPYAFTILSVSGYGAKPTSGYLSVSGSPVDQQIGFTRLALFPVTFTESGLSRGTSWAVTFDGTTQNCTVGAASGPCGTTTIVFTVFNGTYFYTESATGYSASLPAGSIVVNGGPSGQSISYTASTTFALTFIQIGLPPGVPWSVTVNGYGTNHSGSGGPITFLDLPQGPHDFTVGRVPGFVANPSSGAATVSDSDAASSIQFTPLRHPYSITFTENGLPVGTSWTVTVNGTLQQNASGGPIVFVGLINGSYSYAVGAVSGYNASPSSGSITVSGDNASQSITFNASGGGGGGLPPFCLFGLCGTTLYALIGGVVIVCGVVAVVAAIRARRPPSGAPSGENPPPAARASSAAGSPVPPMEDGGPPAPPAPGSVKVRSCRNCGGPIGPTSRFCPGCGAWVE